MESNIIYKFENKNIENNKLNINLDNIKSNYILRKIYGNILKKKSLEIFRYNKKIQKRLNYCFKDYKEYCQTFTPIEIEIKLTEDSYSKFINIKKNEESFYHIYINNNKKEIKNKYETDEQDKVTKIKIIIDYQVKSFKELFSYCYCIESINFKKFYRNNITDMSYMFSGCSSLKELNLNNFNTNNVTDISWMFDRCSSLKELNLNNFNTHNVTDMSYMFSGCSDDLKMKIKSENKNIEAEAFY